MCRASMYVDIPIICTDTVINGFQEVIGGRLCYDGMILVSTTTDDGRGVELSVDDSDVDRDVRACWYLCTVLCTGRRCTDVLTW